MVAVTLYLVIAAVVLTGVWIKFFYRRRRKDEPPLVPGNFLWGSGAAFKAHAVKFLHKCVKNHGEIFTIRLLNQHLTIVADPHSYEHMAKEKNFDFDPIQKQVNHNVFSFELVDARKMLKEAGKTVKGPWLRKGMRNFSTHLTEAFQRVIEKDINGNDLAKVTKGENWGREGLRDLTSRTIFSAMFYTIFGRGKTTDAFEPMMVYRNFDLFHRYFNFLWLGVPVKVFPKAVKALVELCQQPTSAEYLQRSDVSEYIRFSTEFMLAHNQTEQDIIGHNLVYLHVNYNTFRMTFWAVYHLLEDRRALQDLQAEVNSAIASKIQDGGMDDEGNVNFTVEDIDSLPILDSIVHETLRMCSGVFMVRTVIEDTNFTMNSGETYSVRKGDKVAMYPPITHKDPEIYEDPEVYKHDRFVGAKFYKNGQELKQPIMAFGSLCPGKRYALTQSKWFLFCLVHMFDLELVDGQRTQEDPSYYGHEILPPCNDVEVRYKVKDSHYNLAFV